MSGLQYLVNDIQIYNYSTQLPTNKCPQVNTFKLGLDVEMRLDGHNGAKPVIY
jgi:hypothetical protein